MGAGDTFQRIQNLLKNYTTKDRPSLRQTDRTYLLRVNTREKNKPHCVDPGPDHTQLDFLFKLSKVVNCNSVLNCNNVYKSYHLLITKVQGRRKAK